MLEQRRRPPGPQPQQQRVQLQNLQRQPRGVPETARELEQSELDSEELTRLQMFGPTGMYSEELPRQALEQLQPLVRAQVGWEERRQWDRDRVDSTGPLPTATR